MPFHPSKIESKSIKSVKQYKIVQTRKVKGDSRFANILAEFIGTKKELERNSFFQPIFRRFLSNPS